ncbi:MAG: OmpA family protein, partial [Bacteroidaceae bacterium]|nr:OmpA family protein [Bacteroidaceae bacterium]
DKGTGNAAINKRISEKRAQKVADVLVKNFGISSDRIDFNSLGDTDQPFSKNDMNRVCICIAK